MNLAILTSTFTGRPVAVDPDLVGEIRDLSASRRLGKTLLVSKRNRRVAWEVNEHFHEVMIRLEAAAGNAPLCATRRPKECPRGAGDSGTPVEDPAARTWALLVERAEQLPPASPMTISSSLVLWLVKRSPAAGTTPDTQGAPTSSDELPEAGRDADGGPATPGCSATQAAEGGER